MQITKTMNDFPAGNIVKMQVTDPKHYNGEQMAVQDDDVSTSFKDMFVSAIGKVNDLQVNSDSLYQKMIYEPESVDVHQVMIAQQKAELALTFAKSVRDEAIRSYRELMNLR